jgi:NADPH-dependent 2,4-dienoyl-CoA reductase/sulfur reductase-like enzyme
VTAISSSTRGPVVGLDALFVPPRFVATSQLLLDLGCDLDAHGWVSIDGTGRTSIPGVWAAGNVVDPRAQVITAAGALQALGTAVGQGGQPRACAELAHTLAGHLDGCSTTEGPSTHGRSGS